MVDPSVSTCQDCRTCELYCAAYHDGASGLELNRLWQTRNIFRGEYGVLTCKQCLSAPCMAACPRDAISEDAESGAKIINPELCNGCKLCIKACPCEPPRINFNSLEKKALKCDLCAGRPGGPICVEKCPTMCLEIKSN